MSYLKINVRLTKRGFFVLLILYLLPSTWYYLFHTQILVQALERIGATLWTDWARVCFYFSIVFSIFAGIFYVDKVDKLSLIYTWAAIMPIAAISLAFAQNLTCILVLVSILGGIFGMGVLAYSVYFCNLTLSQERGRVIGIIVFASLLTTPMFLSFTKRLSFLDALCTCVFLGVGIFIVRLLKPKERMGLTTNEQLSTVQSYNKRTFLLYLIPWLIFCLVNGPLAEIAMTHWYYQFAEFVFQAQVLQYLAASFGALVGGVFADWMGRRIALSIGLVSYGIGATLSGLISTSGFFLLTAITNGLSWGVFLVLYNLVVWGDLASTKTCAPFYAAGFITFYFSMGVRYLVTPKILHIPVIYVELVSSFLIFLSNVPIIFAKETLPPYITEKMYLSLHIQWIKKILKKQKSSEKN